ncbi:hypothetical protein ECH_0598 [Ehrlichia chaffeensis str. Arkansas]|uniref:Uncharacterized protein n=1 Tax=Ehrlichia chaffeensis (strain ATCC CRL-10679 / Arkansas) TaxID=205920 RepID=Q2GGM4_EHRCR|nr:hypothetical protein ECH_0598 [Ehrlichia chaffeensis str. Arkansas]
MYLLYETLNFQTSFASYQIIFRYEIHIILIILSSKKYVKLLEVNIMIHSTSLRHDKLPF